MRKVLHDRLRRYMNSRTRPRDHDFDLRPRRTLTKTRNDVEHVARRQLGRANGMDVLFLNSECVNDKARNKVDCSETKSKNFQEQFSAADLKVLTFPPTMFVTQAAHTIVGFWQVVQVSTSLPGAILAVQHLHFALDFPTPVGPEPEQTPCVSLCPFLHANPRLSFGFVARDKASAVEIQICPSF